MSDPSLDRLFASPEGRKLKRMMSPEAYEALREKVRQHGPEAIKEEMKKNERLAELNFAMESEPKMRETVKRQIEKDLAEQGIEHVLEEAPSAEAKRSLEQGKFILQVSAHPKTHQDALIVIPEGNVQEKLPLTQQLSDHYVSQFLSKKP